MSDTAIYFSLLALVLLAVPVLWFLHLLEDPWRDRILIVLTVLGVTFLTLGLFSTRDGAGGSQTEAKATFERLIQAETAYYREHGRYTDDIAGDLHVRVPTGLDTVRVRTNGKLAIVTVGVRSNVKHLFDSGWIGQRVLSKGRPPR